MNSSQKSCKSQTDQFQLTHPVYIFVAFLAFEALLNGSMHIETNYENFTRFINQGKTPDFSTSQHDLFVNICYKLEFLKPQTKRYEFKFIDHSFFEIFACWWMFYVEMKRFKHELMRFDAFHLDSVEKRGEAHKNIEKEGKILQESCEKVAKRSKNIRHFLQYFDELHKPRMSSVEILDGFVEGDKYLLHKLDELEQQIVAADYLDKFLQKSEGYYRKNVIANYKSKPENKFPWYPSTYHLLPENGIRETTCEEITELDFNNMKLPLTLVGDAMMGKSSSFVHIVDDWVNKNEKVRKKWEIVFYLSMSQVRTSNTTSATTVPALCFFHMLHEVNMLNEAPHLQQIILRHIDELGRDGKVLCLLDDYHMVAGRCDVLDQIFKQPVNVGKRIPAVIISSMRPYDFASLNLRTGILLAKGYTSAKQLELALNAREGVIKKQIDNGTYNIWEDWYCTPGLISLLCQKYEENEIKPCSLVSSQLAVEVWYHYLRTCRESFYSDARNKVLKASFRDDILVPIAAFAKKQWEKDKDQFVFTLYQLSGTNKRLTEYAVNKGWISKDYHSIDLFRFWNKSFHTFLVAFALSGSKSLKFTKPREKLNVCKNLQQSFDNAAANWKQEVQDEYAKYSYKSSAEPKIKSNNGIKM